MEIKLDLNDKNWAKLMDGNFTIHSEAVPRVGEIIDLGTSFEEKHGDPSTFIVTDVTWKVLGENLTPHLECHCWLDGDRQLELETRGWVKPYATN
ncbi:MAG: hypothetical protein JKY55_17830 [Aliivibrio sp.]|uniref:hypothetical protein n=1 Tax=Aliivibrio sp. TaxID=1872443 RepID=UPI001A5A34E4|nr:hypothetical protein [Aliivibrio sp.]